MAAIEILGRASKKELQEEVREIFYMHSGGRRVGVEYEQLLLDIIDLASSGKKGQLLSGGIDHFIVDMCKEYSSECFQIVRPNGETIEFSVKKIIDEYKPSSKPKSKKPVKEKIKLIEFDLETKDIFIEFAITTSKLTDKQKVEFVKRIST